MKITQREAVAAFVTLNQMSMKPMNSFTAYKLFRLKKALKDPVDFQAEEERKIATELGGEITEDGRLNLPDGKLAMYKERRNELESLECEIDREKTEIHMKELPNISMADMEILEPFIDWKE